MNDDLKRIEEMIGKLIGMVGKTNEKIDALENRMENLEANFAVYRKESIERLDRMDANLEHLAQKWIETDREVFLVKQKVNHL